MSLYNEEKKETTLMNIGKVIHRIRNEAKLTQAQFSEIFGVSQQSVQKWESGDSTPSLDKLIQILKVYVIIVVVFM